MNNDNSNTGISRRQALAGVAVVGAAGVGFIVMNDDEGGEDTLSGSNNGTSSLDSEPPDTDTETEPGSTETESNGGSSNTVAAPEYATVSGDGSVSLGENLAEENQLDVSGDVIAPYLYKGKVEIIEPKNTISPDWSEEAYFTKVWNGETEIGGELENHTIDTDPRRIDPTNDHIDVYMVHLIEDASTDDPTLRVDVFVDEQYRETVDTLNLAWGHDWEHFREYEFQEIDGSDGVYMDQIYDEDVRRLRGSSDSEAELNVAVGNFDDGEVEYSDDFIGVTAR